MDNLRDLLGKYTPQEPPEIAAIKQYLQDQFKADCKVAFQGEAIVITVRSASLANALRFHSTKLRDAAQTDKRLVIRIG